MSGILYSILCHPVDFAIMSCMWHEFSGGPKTLKEVTMCTKGTLLSGGRVGIVYNMMKRQSRGLQ